ncbi:MAG TPA: RNA polymerase sigma factor [Lacunisphaera sp.]|nr:RNA polymerase sigma factor [Lacunisphaera sp.]
MDDDANLLREFAVRRDEASFRLLVERRIGFVYAINLRRLRNPHLAQDATQAVFVALARKAETVARCPSLAGWLHRSSCYESRNLMRTQINRMARESEAQRLGTTVAATPDAGPPGELEAMLDEVLNQLPEPDRDAILARFFSDRSYAEIGAALNLSENAARMRVDRALGRLREHLERRGFKSSAVVLAGLLPACASAAVPGGLALTITHAALAGSVVVAAVPAALFASMNASKIIASAVGVLAVAGFVGYEMHQSSVLRDELTALRREHARATDRMRGLEQQVSSLKASPGSGGSSTGTAAAAPAAASGASAAPAVASAPPEIKGVTRGAPAGWRKNGSKPDAFEVGVDANHSWGGMPSAYAKSISTDAKDAFGGMMQAVATEQYKNKRVRMNGWIKTEDIAGGSGQLWLRVDGPGGGNTLAFDNMNDRAPKGTTDWEEYSIVLDVPETATSLNYGYFLRGTGQMWINGVTFELVGDDVPSTDMYRKRPALPPTPVNLGFKPAAPSGG